MPQMYVHYYVNATFGLTYLHFSANAGKPNVFVKNKTIFNLAQIGIQQIPSAMKLWDASSKCWKVHNNAWVNLMPYYTKAPEIYGMVPYPDKTSFDAFMTQTQNFSGVSSNGFAAGKSDAQAAKGFFNAQAFNHAVTQTATELTERETFISLLGLNNWGSFDSLDKVAAKKAYRAAALKLHPDRNNGDGSQMSKLNELWSIYGGR